MQASFPRTLAQVDLGHLKFLLDPSLMRIAELSCSLQLSQEYLISSPALIAPLKVHDRNICYAHQARR